MPLSPSPLPVSPSAPARSLASPGQSRGRRTLSPISSWASRTEASASAVRRPGCSASRVLSPSSWTRSRKVKALSPTSKASSPSFFPPAVSPNGQSRVMAAGSTVACAAADVVRLSSCPQAMRRALRPDSLAFLSDSRRPADGTRHS